MIQGLGPQYMIETTKDQRKIIFIVMIKVIDEVAKKGATQIFILELPKNKQH